MPIISQRGKISLTPEEEEFVTANWQILTNQQLADALGMRLTRTRTILYEMGFKRMELEYCTSDQVQYLKDNYKIIGDVEMAEIFDAQWNKNKGWSKKHIEKKRRYLKLKRTKIEIAEIQVRNTINGRFAICNKKRWEATGVTPVGEIKIWRNGYNKQLTLPVIKTEKGFVHYYRWLWIKNYGEIPSDILVVPKKGIVSNDLFLIGDLELITRAEHSLRNAESRMQYPEEIRQNIRLLNKLKKEIKITHHDTENKREIR